MPGQILQMTTNARLGQVSLEYLILSAIFLSALAISASLLFDLRNKTENEINMISVSSAAGEISQAVGQVCALGGENARTITGLPEKFTLEYDKGSGMISVIAHNITAKSSVSCMVVIEESEYSGSVMVKAGERKLGEIEGKEEGTSPRAVAIIEHGLE